jgi:hypothetical protein
MSTLGFMSFHGGISERVDGFTMSKGRFESCIYFFDFQANCLYTTLIFVIQIFKLMVENASECKVDVL